VVRQWAVSRPRTWSQRPRRRSPCGVPVGGVEETGVPESHLGRVSPQLGEGNHNPRVRLTKGEMRRGVPGECHHLSRDIGEILTPFTAPGARRLIDGGEQFEWSADSEIDPGGRQIPPRRDRLARRPCRPGFMRARTNDGLLWQGADIAARARGRIGFDHVASPGYSCDLCCSVRRTWRN
jgi:hypothetical protein